MDLKIDPEFAGKIPPLTDEEYRQLEENILADGRVINPLIIWNGVIVDGHNRYRILQEHPGIPFDTFEKEFPDRFAVIAWICKNQLGRRNLTPEQRKYLIGKQYEAEKASVPNASGRNQFSEEVGGQNDHQPTSEKTSEKIAREIGASERFVRRAEEFARGVDAAEEAVPGMKQEILSGKLKGTDQAIRAIGKAEPEQREELTRKLQHPSPTLRFKGGCRNSRIQALMGTTVAQMPGQMMWMTARRKWMTMTPCRCSPPHKGRGAAGYTGDIRQHAYLGWAGHSGGHAV